MTTSDKFVSQANPVAYAGKVVNAPVAKNHFTDNDKPLRAKLAKSEGTIAKVTWNYSVHGLVKPGMAVSASDWLEAAASLATRRSSGVRRVFASMALIVSGVWLPGRK